jgi:hypothetical protein
MMLEKMLKYILLLNTLLKVNGLLRLYNTDVLYRNALKDCLYSNTVDNKINEWILIRYCIDENDFENSFECYGNVKLTFEELKFKNISSENLFKWNAPIDTINNYEKYLIENDLSMKNDLYCNLSSSYSNFSLIKNKKFFLENFFGKDCSYSFDKMNSDLTFNEIILNQFDKKVSLVFVFELLDDEHFLTCYEGMKCNSTICLDWRQICDGFIDCENGEDEFSDCFLMEINQCNENEYRCLNGMCIPKTYFIDFSYDCGDMTDEEYSIDELISELAMCYNSPMILCEFSQTRWNLFSCGDGQYELIEDSEPLCANGRDSFYRRNLFDSSLSANNNENFECLFLLLCVSEDDYLDLFDYDTSQCLCTKKNRKKNYCLEYFEKYCPSWFYFQTETNFAYPFVKYIFNKSEINSLKWWQPTYICYQNKSCPNFLSNNYLLIDELVCIKSEIIPNLVFYRLRKFFSYCDISIEDKSLFYCQKSKQMISKYRVEDSIKDCYYGEDENDKITSTIISSLNLTDRFKCKQDNKWIIRLLILYYEQGFNDNFEYCTDESYKLYLGKCKRPSDLACQFIRGTFIPSIYNIFRENCNGKNQFNSLIDGETDETNCEEWSSYKCDNYWDFENGIDELNCLDTTTYYLTQTVFKCNRNEHYCADENGTMTCLSIEHAGNQLIDCLGASDERKMIEQSTCPESWMNTFKCRSGQCVSIFFLCNKKNNCRDNDDDIICPWVFNSTCTNMEFPCKNGACIPRIEKQCNGIIDCQPDGEDEWFCDLIHLKDKQFSLINIEEYPLNNRNSSKIAIVDNYDVNQTFQIKKVPEKRKNVLDDWYCNRGLILRYRLSNKKCFCPPSYYGLRCQYQSERILITIKIDMPINLARYENKNSFIIIIARLILDDQVFDHEQILRISLMKQIFYLNYPQPPPKKQGNWFVRFDAYLINMNNVHYKTSWLFNIPFSFLPVNRLVLHLMMRDSQICNSLNCIHGICQKYSNYPYDEYCQCEENWSGKYCNERMSCSCVGGGKCIDGYLTPICICPLGRIGNECRVLFNPCIDVKCKNGGTCLPLDERQLIKFVCSCPNDYYGIYCEQINSQIHIEFSSSLSLKSSELELVSVFVHFLKLEKDSPGILFVENRFLYKQIKLNEVLNVHNTNHDYLSTFILIEIYFEDNISNYYIGAIVKNNLTSLSIKLDAINRCPYVDELILNETIRKFPLRKKVKYYHYVCEMNHLIKWFHDESSLCFCDRYRQPDCLFFQRPSVQCSINYCQNNGQCIENSFNGVSDFACVCNGCSYGSLCQLITSEYILSFDIMLGQDIKANMSFMKQPFLIKFVLSIIIFMILVGTLSNVLSLITFRQRKIREYGCAIYLFYLTLIGQIGLTSFASRYFYLLITQLYTVNNHWSAYWSCIILEYILSVCPMLFDWLIVCIAVERCVNIIRGASFKKSDSVWWAKRLIPFFTLIIICSSWHDLFIHRLIYDPRITSEHTWCVIKFSWMWIKYYRLIINLINLIIPGLINFIATIFLLHKTTRRKQTFGKKKSENTYWKIFRKQIPMYGTPLGLVILSIMRVIFSFTLVCITKQWHKYAYFIAYFISFAPFITTFPIFVLTAEVYKKEFNNFIARFIRKLKARWIL